MPIVGNGWAILPKRPFVLPVVRQNLTRVGLRLAWPDWKSALVIVAAASPGTGPAGRA